MLYYAYMYIKIEYMQNYSARNQIDFLGMEATDFIRTQGTFWVSTGLAIIQTLTFTLTCVHSIIWKQCFDFQKYGKV